MNDINVGKLLRNIRKSKNLTQEDVANVLGVGRNAIVQLEQGTRKISADELFKLEKFYNVELHNYIDVSSEKHNVKGIILAGGSGTRLYPITEAISKQLVPVYDKPMIYYPLSVLMQAGIKDILIITTPIDQVSFQRLLGDGSRFGINLSYTVQPSPDGLAQAFLLGEDFIADNPCAMILGDNIYFGNGLEKELKKAINNSVDGYATIFGYKVKDPERFGIMEIDEFNNVLSVEEKPQYPKSDYAITGLYFYPKGVSAMAKTIKPSKRGELEITSLNDCYLRDNKLKSSILGDGYTWFDTGTYNSLLDASNMIRTIEENKDTIICCPEAIAYQNGWIDDEILTCAADLMSKNSYGKYLSQLVQKKNKEEAKVKKLGGLYGTNSN